MSERQMLNAVLRCAPVIAEAWGPEAAIGVADLEKYLYYRDGAKLKLGIKPGDPVKEGSMAYQAARSFQRLVKQIDKKVYGVPYTAIGTPIINEQGEIEGVMLVGFPVEKQENVRAMSERVKEAISSINTGMSALAAAAEELSESAKFLFERTKGIRSQIEVTDKVLGLIKDVSTQTHMLGINAAIQAAHAGQHGRGFSVVAEQIRKLAVRTNESVKEITQALNMITTTTMELAQGIEKLSATTEEQTASVQEIAASVEELEAMSSELSSLAEELLV